MLQETTKLLKRTFPSHFLPRLNDGQAKELRSVITNKAVDIAYDLTKIYNSICDSELNVGLKFLKEDFCTFQKNLFELCKLSNEQKTSALVSTIYSELEFFIDSLEQLDYSRRNCVLFQGIANNAASLLFNFKKSQYKKLLDDLTQLKQSIA